MSQTQMSAQAVRFFERMRRDGAELSPGLLNLGIRPDLWIKDVSYGYVHYQWPNTGDRDIGRGVAFGGWIAALSDNVVSFAMMSALEDGESFTTTELQTRILRPVKHGKISIEGRVLSRGRTTGLVEADWRDDEGTLLTKVTAAKAIRQ